jgi:hypothetical protein
MQLGFVEPDVEPEHAPPEHVPVAQPNAGLHTPLESQVSMPFPEHRCVPGGHPGTTSFEPASFDLASLDPASLTPVSFDPDSFALASSSPPSEDDTSCPVPPSVDDSPPVSPENVGHAASRVTA